MTEDTEERLIALETRLAHQEATIDELNRLVYEQGQTIGRLEKDLAQVVERLREMAREKERL